MALTTTVVGFCFVFENEDFLFSALSQYFCSYFSAFNTGSTYFNITVVNDCQYLVEYYVGINIGIQFFDENVVAFLTRYCFPPVLIIAYMSDTSSSIYSLNTASLAGACEPLHAAYP